MVWAALNPGGLLDSPVEMPRKHPDIQPKEYTVVKTFLKSNRQPWAKAGSRDGKGEDS